MLGDVYTVKYLETFRRELDEAADYIAFELENVTAADKLLADVEAAIERTSTAPTVTKPYGTDAATGDVYYRIGVRLRCCLRWRIIDVGWLSRNRSWIRHEGWLSRG